MAEHEALANCKIRRMPVSQGGGLGVYATEDIEYAQELLIVNRECPTIVEEEPQVEAPRLDEQAQPNADTEARAESGIIETSDTPQVEDREGRQYEVLDDLGGWKMHEPTNPWQIGILLSKARPPSQQHLPLAGAHGRIPVYYDSNCRIYRTAQGSLVNQSQLWQLNRGKQPYPSQ